jgi:hypothetical protein
MMWNSLCATWKALNDTETTPIAPASVSFTRYPRCLFADGLPGTASLDRMRTRCRSPARPVPCPHCCRPVVGIPTRAVKRARLRAIRSIIFLHFRQRSSDDNNFLMLTDSVSSLRMNLRRAGPLARVSWVYGISKPYLWNMKPAITENVISYEARSSFAVLRAISQGTANVNYTMLGGLVQNPSQKVL